MDVRVLDAFEVVNGYVNLSEVSLLNYEVNYMEIYNQYAYYMFLDFYNLEVFIWVFVSYEPHAFVIILHI